jgi:soluble lytic murein transglycosylase-like protein
LGNNQFIGAQGKTGIGIVDLNSSYGSYFKKRFSGNIRRIAGGSNVAGAMAGGAGGSGASKNLSYGLVGTGTGKAYQMAPSAVRTVINIEAQKQKVNPYLIASIIKQESAFKYNAGSGAGAKGYMQLMPTTAKSLGVTNVYDAGQNIAAGTKYVAQQIRKFGSIELGLAAYNAGPGNVNKAIKKAGGRTDWASVSRYLPKETRNYVPKVMQYR